MVHFAPLALLEARGRTDILGNGGVEQPPGVAFKSRALVCLA
jgi:hypothetical protein